MPPFKLEALKNTPQTLRTEKMLYCKKVYNEKVKVTNWEQATQSHCIDMNPYDPKCYDLMKSHYKRLGTNESGWITTNKEIFTNHWEEGTIDGPHIDRKMVNFFTFKENTKHNRNKICPDVSKLEKLCEKLCMSDYRTTMQKDYEMPYPYEMKRLANEQPAGNYKKMATHTECKFIDDNFVNYTKALQEAKGFLHVDNTNNFEWQ